MNEKTLVPITVDTIQEKLAIEIAEILYNNGISDIKALPLSVKILHICQNFINQREQNVTNQ